MALLKKGFCMFSKIIRASNPFVFQETEKLFTFLPIPALCHATTLPGNNRSLHTSNVLQLNQNEPKNWLKYNEIVLPPTKEGETKRDAVVHHQQAHVKYSYEKMWYLTSMVRGMTVDEARKQLQFKNRAGAFILKEIIEKAQDLAVQDHNVEFRSNLWIAEAFTTRAGYVKGMRKHRGNRFGVVKYGYIHVFVKLHEGKPPKNYYPQKPTGNQLKAEYIDSLRQRRIFNSL